MIGSLIFIASIVIPLGDNTRMGGSDKELLQGAWIPVAVAKNGKVMSMEEYQRQEGEAEEMRLVFAHDTFSAEVRPQNEETIFRTGHFNLDTTQSPKQISFVLEHETREAIYSVSAADLRICIGERRPAAFKTKGEPNFQLWYFKRDKPQGSSN
jgi:uncharacterized protein (TIGR03067 family)